MAVDIGSEAINRSYTRMGGLTYIMKEHPATAAGEITSVDIWANTNITSLRVGTFYVLSGNTLKCRDSEAISGVITAGSKTTKTVSIAVEIGDFLGCFFVGGYIARTDSGYAGLQYISGEYIDPNDEAIYNTWANNTISLGGYISEAASLVSKTFQSIWNVRKLVNDTVNYKWNVSVIALTLVSNTLQLVFNVRALVSKTSQLKWHVLKLVDKSLQSIWNVRKLIGKSLQSIWNVRKLIGKSLQSIWNVAPLPYSVSNILELRWYNLLRILKISSEVARDLTIKSTIKKGLKITSTIEGK